MNFMWSQPTTNGELQSSERDLTSQTVHVSSNNAELTNKHRDSSKEQCAVNQASNSAGAFLQLFASEVWNKN
jgi:hypothetical protein